MDEEEEEKDEDKDVLTQQGRFQKVLPHSPERCKANNAHGQCQFRKRPGSDYCISHTAGRNKADKQAVHDFRLGQYQERVDQFAGSRKVNTLKGEVGILRLLLEQILSQCTNPNAFLSYSEKITNLVNITNKTLTVSHALEEKTGLVLSRDKVLLICDRIITIIAEHITDTDDLEVIANKIGTMLTEVE